MHGEMIVAKHRPCDRCSEVAVIIVHARSEALTRYRKPLSRLDTHFDVEVEGDRERVKTGTKVGGTGRNTNSHCFSVGGATATAVQENASSPTKFAAARMRSDTDTQLVGQRAANE